LNRELADLSDAFVAEVVEPQLAEFAQSIGLSVENLRRLQVGWSNRHSAWSFPMRDADGHVVGIRLRSNDGRKLSVAGGHAGLHIPTDIAAPSTLLISEGPTDTAAALDLGFAAIGRPSCVGAVDITVDLMRKMKPSLVVIVADNDEAGQKGAASLASSLALQMKQLKIITPARGIKDLRAWKIGRATPTEVKAVIDAAALFSISISGSKHE